MIALTPANIHIQTLQTTVIGNSGVQVDVLRLDLIHPVISGNKWFKLRPYLEAAIAQQKKIATFGGAWSNHILATAAACNLKNISCAGIIRGEQPDKLSSTLIQAKALGMGLYFLSREEYKQRTIPPILDIDEYLVVDEGGYGLPGASGAADIIGYFDPHSYHTIACAVGTGTMMAGLLNVAGDHSNILGISVLKGNVSATDAVQRLLDDQGSEIRIIHDYHFGGYAKHNPDLISFMNEWFIKTKIPTDFVYTGKLFYALNELVSAGVFPHGTKVLIIHSGGLQGNASLGNGTLIF